MAIQLWMRLKPTTAKSAALIFQSLLTSATTHTPKFGCWPWNQCQFSWTGRHKPKSDITMTPSIYIHSHRFHSYTLIPSTLITTTTGNLYVTLSPLATQLSKLDTAPLCLCDCCDCLNNSDPDVKSTRLTCWETDSLTAQSVHTPPRII